MRVPSGPTLLGVLGALGPVALLTAVLGLSACGSLPTTTVGSGQLKTESRAVSGFTALAFAGVGDMTITQTGTESLSITAEDNLLPLLTADVSGGTLTVAERPGTLLQPTRPIHYVLTVKQLGTITLSGDGTITGSGLASDNLQVTLSGAGTLTLSGVAAQQEVLLSGAGSYDASNLRSNTATVTVSGLGSARVNVRDALDATVSGAGSIVYLGTPTVTQHVTGAGSVTKG